MPESAQKIQVHPVVATAGQEQIGLCRGPNDDRS